MRRIKRVLLFGLGIYFVSIIQQVDSLASDAVTQLPPNHHQVHPIGANYIIGPGDVLDISVWKEAALTSFDAGCSSSLPPLAPRISLASRPRACLVLAERLYPA